MLSSESLVHLEGTLTIHGKQLDGRFRLGLAPGTLDDPREDLSDRLINAAGMRMFDVVPETGERVLKFTRNMIAEPGRLHPPRTPTTQKAAPEGLPAPFGKPP